MALNIFLILCPLSFQMIPNKKKWTYSSVKVTLLQKHLPKFLLKLQRMGRHLKDEAAQNLENNIESNAQYVD